MASRFSEVAIRDHRSTELHSRLMAGFGRVVTQRICVPPEL